MVNGPGVHAKLGFECSFEYNLEVVIQKCVESKLTFLQFLRTRLTVLFCEEFVIVRRDDARYDRSPKFSRVTRDRSLEETWLLGDVRRLIAEVHGFCVQEMIKDRSAFRIK